MPGLAFLHDTSSQVARIAACCVIAAILARPTASALGDGQPYLVKDINSGGSSVPYYLIKVGDRLFFGADDGVHGRELWVSDGTEQGTYMVVDLVAGPDAWSALFMREVGGRAFYQASNASGGLDLWVSDGTPEGTSLIVNISDGPWFPNMEALGNLLLFEKETIPSGNTDLWRTDGTPQGTVYVKNVRVNDMGPTTGLALFLAGVGPGTTIPGFDAWKTDGTTNGTVLLADLRGAIWMTEFKGGAAFQGDLDPFGEEPWFTDGTVAGTVMLKDINPGPGWSGPNCFGAFNGLLYFNAFEPSTGRETWRSDGTPEGTALFADINPTGDGGGCDFTDVNGTLFFDANHYLYGRELWKTDGTPEGTVLVKDIRLGPAHSGIENLVAAGGKLYFRADDGVHGFELWVSDGTEAGTYMVRDINPGPSNGLGHEPMTNVYGTLYSVAAGDTGAELWALDTRPEPIPSASSWGILCFGIILLGAGSIVLRAKSKLPRNC